MVTVEAEEVTATEAVKVAELLQRSLSIIIGHTASSVGTRAQIVPDAQTDIKWKQPPLIKREDAQRDGKDSISESSVQIKVN